VENHQSLQGYKIAIHCGNRPNSAETLPLAEEHEFQLWYLQTLSCHLTSSPSDLFTDIMVINNTCMKTEIRKGHSSTVLNTDLYKQQLM